MNAFWIILLLILIPFVVFSIISLIISCTIHKMKCKYIIFDKIINWKVIKGLYKEFYKASFYIIIAIIILLFLGSVLAGYYADITHKSSYTNITHALRYFIPTKGKADYYIIKADTLVAVSSKDTSAFKNYNQNLKGLITKDSTTKVIIIAKGRIQSGNSNNNLAENNTKILGHTSNNNILEDTSNIINHTSNLLTYITIFFGIMGILGGIGIYKYFSVITRLDKENEQLKNKTLDAGLITLSAVPLVEATQITSDEYNLAIETITNSIIENRESIEENPKYSKLLIVEALYCWNLRDYSRAADILEKALKLAYQGGEDKTVQTISYHLARVYKQRAFETGKDKYFKRATKYARNTFSEQKKVINLSIASIRYSKGKNGEDLRTLKDELKNCMEIKKENNFSETNEIINFASLTAFTVIALCNDDNITKETIRTNYAKKSLLLIEEKLNTFAGNNIKASWYRTALLLAISIFKNSNISISNENIMKIMEEIKTLELESENNNTKVGLNTNNIKRIEIINKIKRNHSLYNYYKNQSKGLNLLNPVLLVEEEK